MQVTRTLKLKFHNLNAVKASLFASTTTACTELANQLLKLLPPEINYQNWQLFKQGDTYSVSFPTLHGVKRVPIEIKSNHWQSLLDRLLSKDKTILKGTLKLEQKEQRWMKAVNHTVSRRIVNFADWQNADLVLEDLSGCRQTMKQSKKQRSDNSQSRHAWAYYDLQTKLEYKQALNGRQVHYRPPHYTSKTSSVNGVIGTRDGNWFKCNSGVTLQADFNAGRNLAIWDYRSCLIDSRKIVSVMDAINLSNGVTGSPRNSMNFLNGRAVQLSLFDCTDYETRRENPRLERSGVVGVSE